MKNENCFDNLKFIGKNKSTKNEFLSNDAQKETQIETTSDQENELDPVYKLNFKLIDIDKVFAN